MRSTHTNPLSSIWEDPYLSFLGDYCLKYLVFEESLFIHTAILTFFSIAKSQYTNLFILAWNKYIYNKRDISAYQLTGEH